MVVGLIAGGLLAAAGAEVAGAMTLPANPLIVEDLGKGRLVVDGHRAPRPWARQTLGRLATRWGDPDGLVATAKNTNCVAVWRSLGIVAHLANYGGGDACTSATGRIQTIELRGGIWRTVRGLAVGNRAARITRLYPKSMRGSAARVRLLRPYTVPCTGSCGGRTVGKASAVSAIVQGGRITRFVVSIHAAGE